MDATSSQIVAMNVGSASVKGALFEVGPEDARCCSRVSRDLPSEPDGKRVSAEVFDALLERAGDVSGVDHRFVHGGERFDASAVVDRSVEEPLDGLASLAPLHNPLALMGIRVGQKRLPSARHVVVFDTAFHEARPSESKRYALSWDLCDELGIQRDGFHGIAHAALVEALAAESGTPRDAVNGVTLQLGSGCSACAVERGRSIETSMGFSPLGGLPMATRSGDLDPGVLIDLVRRGWSAQGLTRMLHRESGLQGLAGRGSKQDAAAANGRVSRLGSRPVFVFETDEERLIARETNWLVTGEGAS